MEDLYAILGVNKKASKKELREAYYSLAKKYHPDKNNGTHSEEFAKISLAYSVLSSPKRRKIYDRTGSIDNFNFRVAALQVISSLFHQIIGNPTINVKTDNVLFLISNMIKQKMNTTQTQITNFNKVKIRLKDVRDRISGNDHFFKQMIDNNLGDTEKQLLAFQNDLEVGKTSLDILKEYKYAIDEKPGRFGTFVGLSNLHSDEL